MYEPDSMAIALVNKWNSWNNGQLLRNGQNSEQKYLIALKLERLFESINQEVHGNRTLFIPKFEQELAEMMKRGEI